MSALDDLFGAFDGSNEDQAEEPVEPPEAKRPRIQDEKDENANDASDNADASSQKVDPTSSSRSSYTMLMSTNTTSSHLKDPTTVVAPDVPKAADPVASATREIATGTSHDKSVRSYSAYPKNLPAGQVLPKVDPPKEPAKKYPFQLDPFQQQAVNYIDKEESVLVAAHVSDGRISVAVILLDSPTHLFLVFCLFQS